MVSLQENIRRLLVHLLLLLMLVGVLSRKVKGLALVTRRAVRRLRMGSQLVFIVWIRSWESSKRSQGATAV